VRRILHVVGISFLSIFSIQTIISIVDWLGRWDWLKGFMDTHPRFAVYMHTPFSYFVLMGLGLAPLWAEKVLKVPRLIAKLTNCRMVPDLTTTPVGLIFDSQSKKPGWDREKVNWEWFPEIRVVNNSDIPTTIERVEIRAWIKRGWWSGKENVAITQKQEVDDYEIDLSIDDNFKSLHYTGNRFQTMDNLTDRIRNVHLTRGIGYKGWLRFHVEQVSQADIPLLELQAFLIDSLDNKHEVQYKKKEEKEWDRNFHINLKTRAARSFKTS
jgi:hypothetical protein